MTLYKNQVRIYGYQYEPNFSPDSTKEYIAQQLQAISKVTRNFAEVSLELQEGTSSGSTIRLADTGVEAGTYTNPVITVAPDGRIISISKAPEAASPFPAAGSPGLLLTSTYGAPVWTTAPIGVPTGGTDGQVLTVESGKATWSTPVVASSGVTSITVTGTRDIAVENPTVTSTGEIAISLRPTGVTPGMYRDAMLEIDEQGRITYASSLTPDTPSGTSVTYVGATGDGDVTVTGAPITSSGTLGIGLANTTVIPGSYTNADVTVDAKGRVTNIKNGVAGSGGSSGPGGQDANNPIVFQLWRDSATGGLMSVTIENGAWVIALAATINAEDGSGPIMAENGTDYISSEQI